MLSETQCQSRTDFIILYEVKSIFILLLHLSRENIISHDDAHKDIRKYSRHRGEKQEEEHA
jgi:hypothetical protein